MRLDSTAPPPYLPDRGQSTVLRLGLQAMPDARWMLVDDDLPVFRRHKREAGAPRLDTVYQALPGSEAAQREFRDCLAAHLARDYATRFGLAGSDLVDALDDSGPLPGADLWQCSQWIAEDICLLEPGDEDYRLTAASLCSPSNWRLEDKIGRSVDSIHSPVPHYAATLSEKVNRLLGRLKPDKPVQRFNWSVQPGNSLAWHPETEDRSAGDYWRIERQSLRKLPRTGVIVFAIRIFLYSFTRMEQHANFHADLRHVIGQLDAAERNYKGLNRQA